MGSGPPVERGSWGIYWDMPGGRYTQTQKRNARCGLLATVTVATCLASPARRARPICSAVVTYTLLICCLTILSQTNYFKIYRADFRQIFRVGAVDDLTIVSFSLPRGTLPWQPILVARLCPVGCILLVCTP